MNKLPLSISTSSRKGDVATGFDTSLTLLQAEVEIIVQAMTHLPQVLAVCFRLMDGKERNLERLYKVKEKIGGEWTK